MKALIINFNRLTLARNTAEWIVRFGIEPVFVDNCSYYEPLLEYYYNCPFEIVRLDKNYGHSVVWDLNILDKLEIKDQYILTDPDLDYSTIPDDWFEVLQEGLRRYPAYHKCGFSLEINDLPNTVSGNAVRNEFEAPYWRKILDEQYFEADIDTTFALYRPDIRIHSTCAIRTNRPYTAKHIPWYYDHINDLPEDEQFYFKTCNHSSSGSYRLKR